MIVQINIPKMIIQNIKKNAGNQNMRRIPPKTRPITFARFCTTFIGPDEAFALISVRFCSFAYS